jgi:hypothetical protein
MFAVDDGQQNCCVILAQQTFLQLFLKENRENI